jgi:hypothetical protein
MKIEEVTVTPKMAAEWLGKNGANRKLREHRAAFLARAIEEGKWQTTHQPIAFAKNGRLLDGQHRLRAIVMANKSVRVMVASGVNEETFSVMDAGLPRKMFERLKTDPRRTSIVTSLFRIVGPRPVPHEYEIGLLLDIFEKPFLSIEPLKNQKHLKGTICAAALLRFGQGMVTKKGLDPWLVEAWQKYVQGDLSGAPRVIVSLYKQMVEGITPVGGIANDQFSRAWVALDKRSADVSKITVRDVSGPLGEARQVFHEVTEGVFE